MVLPAPCIGLVEVTCWLTHALHAAQGDNFFRLQANCVQMWPVLAATSLKLRRLLSFLGSGALVPDWQH